MIPRSLQNPRKSVLLKSKSHRILAGGQNWLRQQPCDPIKASDIKAVGVMYTAEYLHTVSMKQANMVHVEMVDTHCIIELSCESGE